MSDAVDSRFGEQPLFFRVGDETLFGIVTPPRRSPQGMAVVTLNAGAYQSSAHRNRFYVNVCRRLAQDGYHGFRFDYHGVGESTGQVAYYKLAEPFVEDLDGAIDVLRRGGIDRFILLGFCFGGRTALSGALRLEGVEAVIMISSPPQDIQEGEGGAARRTVSMSFWQYLRHGLRLRVLRRLFSPATARKQFRQAWIHLRVLFRGRFRRRSGDDPFGDPWAGSGLLQPLEKAMARGVPVLFVYGSEDPFLAGFQKGRLGELMRDSNHLAELLTIDGALSPAREVRGQAEIVEVVSDWLSRRIAGPRAEAAPSR